jgi:hypothetical protein
MRRNAQYFVVYYLKSTQEMPTQQQLVCSIP